ncbi:MAG: 2-dehydropantoate 2-reductase [Verrucomicrobia bacterium]|jgi:2-dehydropantoate 2-reductase|nr:2-dehydropantoate 2-reductase [Verrucomicrobiota bacterium]
MKIGVVGCGALGSYYGGLLCRAGHETHFLLRSDYDAVQKSGVFIESPNGNFHVKPHAHRQAAEIGLCDLILIGLKTTANHAFQELLPSMVGPTTSILTLQNGLGNEEILAGLFPNSHILGGLCFVCLNRTEPGRIRHMDHGLIVMGEFEGVPRPLTLHLIKDFNEAGIPCRFTDNLAKAHWEKLMWNIPFNGLGVAGLLGHAGFDVDPEILMSLPRSHCLDANALLADPTWEARVRGLMQEVSMAANELGFPIAPDLQEKLIERTRTMGPYKASTLIDYERGDPLEMDCLFLLPLNQAQKSGIKVPLLERLALVLGELQKRQDGSK